MMKHVLVKTLGVLALMAGPALAQNWELDGAASHLAYGSIKKDTVGEVNMFQSLSGSVSADGAAQITIDLTSLETNIDIRNERMAEHVFKGAAEAKLMAQIDMDELNALAAGESTVTYADVTLSLGGVEVPLEAELFVMRVAEDRVMVATNDMVFLNTADAGLTAGIDTLMELAKLPGITRTAPVTLRLMFQQGTEEAAVKTEEDTGTTLAALTGDPKKGRRVFNKCKACHKLDAGKKGTGPSLYGIFGATAGQVEGFRYSKAMIESGIVWTPETLAQFLAAPKKTVPGNKMSFNGLKKPADIDDLLAYLADKT